MRRGQRHVGDQTRRLKTEDKRGARGLGRAQLTEFAGGIGRAQLISLASPLFRRHVQIFLVPPLSAEQLPVLTAANAAQFLEWHLYVRRIYGPEPPFPIDLNTFTWFYWDCPLRLKNIYLGDWV